MDAKRPPGGVHMAYGGRRIPEEWEAGVFHLWLRRRMEIKGLTQRELGRRTGVDHSSLSRLMGGGRQPTLKLALALLRELE